MKRQIDKKTTQLKDNLLDLMNDVTNIYQELIDCIEDVDDQCLKAVINKDHQINEKELFFNETLIDYIVAFSPVATDLRESISYLKIANDLERIADYTTNIAKIFRRGVNFETSELKKIKYGLSLIVDFLNQVKELIKNYSSSVAYEIVDNDKELDALYKNYYFDKIANKEKTKDIELVVSTVSILKYLERSGDHIVNIVEHIIFAQKGKHVSL